MPQATRSAGNGRVEKRRRLIDPADLAKRIIFGVIGSFLFSALMFFVQIKAFVAVILAAILTFLGWSTQPPKDVEEAGKKVLGKLKEEAKAHTPPALGMAPGIHLPGGKSPEQLRFEADQKEAERQRREASEIKSLLARAGVVKLDCDEDWPLEKLRVEVPLAEHRAAEEAKKKPILERADKIGLKPDPSLDARTLKQQVEDAEKELAADADYQAQLREWERAMAAWREKGARGPNARCTNPRCGHTMRINPAWGKKSLQCPRCLTFFGGARAMALWRPPPPPKKPLPPRKNPGLLWRIFH